MKSDPKQLENRGFLAEQIRNKDIETSLEQRIGFLKSKIPVERTLGARLLVKSEQISAIDYLIEALQIEKKLYPKIEICHSLVTYREEAVTSLIGILGKIGNNQHKIVPSTDFKKCNYPLPRDIVSRTLIRIGSGALPELLKILSECDLLKLSEAIDTIGFICFYEYNNEAFNLLMKCYFRHQDNDLIKWKILRAMSAFPESIPFLKNEQGKLSNALLQNEIERSLLIISNRLPEKSDE